MAAALIEVLKSARFDTEPSSRKAAKQLKHWLHVFTHYLERREGLPKAKKDTTLNGLLILFVWSVLKLMSSLRIARRMMLP